MDSSWFCSLSPCSQSEFNWWGILRSETRVQRETNQNFVEYKGFFPYEQILESNARWQWILLDQRADERDDGYTPNTESEDSIHQRGSSWLKQIVHQVSYLIVSEGDSKGVHHVDDSDWWRVSPIMDIGYVECVTPEDIVRNTSLKETETSRQGQTYYTADGVVIKNKGEQIKTMYSERDDHFRARYQIIDLTRSLYSISRVCVQGNNVLFTETGGWIINHQTDRYTWFPQGYRVYVLHSWINESPDEKYLRWSDETFFKIGVLRFRDSERHVDPEISVRSR